MEILHLGACHRTRKAIQDSITHLYGSGGYEIRDHARVGEVISMTWRARLKYRFLIFDL